MVNYLTIVSRSLLSLFSLIGFSSSFAQQKNYFAGFTTIRSIDSSRIYKTGSTVSDPLHFRPVDIDIWYPAIAAENDSLLEFKDFLSSFIQRPDFYGSRITEKEALHEAATAFCNMNHCSDSSKLLHFKTASFLNAKRAKGKFPLVLYYASFGSSSFENYTLLEDLAKRGFIVVAIGSVGRFPGDMTMKYEDMTEQVKDGLFALRYLSKWNIDFSKKALIGYSWGGVSAAVTAGKLQGVRCLVSLDGSEFHHYGYNREEDKDFDGIANNKDFKSLSIPYLRLQQNPVNGKAGKDSVYDFSKKLSRSLVVAVDSAEHFNFCCLQLVVRSSGGCGDDRIYNTICRLTTNFLEDRLKGSNKFHSLFRNETDHNIKKLSGNMID